LRKEILLTRLLPTRRILYVNYFEGQGKALYQQICKRDMEGIVCKPAISPYRTIRGKSTWIKVKNPKYSQAEGRSELFNKRRG
jgi:ATP-dependent DNA ligase